ncbi:MAG: threonine-phosphate decarboxylase [Candidatus Omnitrophica bacterium]|nr:threonine-phosphate decarboxylase [Candidatus Omnitrophota bacterium]
MHGGNVWRAAQGPFLRPEQLLDFSADLNPLGPPPALPRLLEEGTRRVGWYPEPTYREFREAAGRLHGIDPAGVLPGNGTAELIHLISRWKAGGRVVVVVPTFTEYERAAAADRSQVVPWPLRTGSGFSAPSWNGSLPFGRADLLFLCNPNNPTGTLWPKEQVLRLIEACEWTGTTVVVDEATMDLVEDGLRYSLVPSVQKFRRLIVLRSLTKAFAIPGLRVGYLAAPPQIVEQLAAIQPPWSMNAPAAFVGTHLIQEEEYLSDSRSVLQKFRISLWEGLKGLSFLDPYSSSANFFLCRLQDSALPNNRLADRLRDRGILIRVCDDFTGLESGRFIRIGVRRPEENQRLLDLLGEVFGNAG